MKHFPTAVRVVAMLLEVLRQRREVAHEAAPVAVEVIQMQRVRTSPGQQGIAAGCAQRLLMWGRRFRRDFLDRHAGEGLT